MITYLVGKIRDVRQVQRKKADGSVQIFCTALIYDELNDKDGHLVIVSENVQFPIEMLPQLQLNLNKFVAIPYLTLNTKNGTYIFPDANLELKYFDKHPFLNEVKK